MGLIGKLSFLLIQTIRKVTKKDVSKQKKDLITIHAIHNLHSSRYIFKNMAEIVYFQLI